MPSALVESIQNAVVAFAVGLPDGPVQMLAGRAVVREGQRLDPQLQLLLKLMAAAGLPRLETMTAPDARAFFRGAAGLLAPSGIELARVADRRLPGPDGDVPVRVYVPRTGTAPHPVLVYYHGGGWTVGDIDTHDGIARALADRAGCIVVSVDYRLGPEHRFPAAFDDAMAAFAWVAANAASIGGDPARLAVGGDSAGGNLAAAVAQQTRAAGLRSPDFQLLVYPVTDLGAETKSYETYADGFYLTRGGMRWFKANYLSAPDDALDPRVSPLRAADVSGLAPAFVMTAGYDPLRDEGRAYADRLRAAGCRVECRNYDGLIHGFFSMGGVVRAAGRAFDDAVSALRAAFGGNG